MKAFRTFLPIFVALPLLAVEAKPSTATTLDALVTEALTENPELKFYEAEIAVAKGERKAAGSWANPEVSGDIGRKRVSDNISTEGTAWSVSVHQTFEWPGRIPLRKAIADRQVQLAEIGLDQFRSALTLEIRRRGFALFTAQRRVEATLEVSERAEELVATLIQREPAGITPLLETRAIEASVIKLRRATSAAAQEAQSALYEINQLRGRPIQMPLAIADAPLNFTALPKGEELIRHAARSNFTLRQREMELVQQGFKIRLSENEAWPSITVGPQFSQAKATDTERIAGVGVSLPLPLWNRNTGNIAAARARELQGQTSLRLAQREVERKILEQAASYELHCKEMARWNPKVVEQLREAAALADRHYRLGAVPLATYLEVQSAYIEALEAIYATQSDALNAQAELERLTGSKLHK